MNIVEIIKSSQLRCDRCITREKAHLEALRIELEIDSDTFDDICTTAQDLKFWIEHREYWDEVYQEFENAEFQPEVEDLAA